MSKTFLKGMYYIPTNDEDPYTILKNANKNKLNFIIIEYTNNDLFKNISNNKKQLSKLFYIQEKISSFEKKYKNTIGILCFKCRSVIGPIRILLSKSIFRGEIFKLQNFYLWCYLNNPTLILSNNNYYHIENENIKKYFTLHSDNFLKSTDNYITLLNKNLKLTPIYTNNGFIFIKNINNSMFDFSKLKQHIITEIKNGNFYISNSDKYYLNFNVTSSKNKPLKINIEINNSDFLNQKFVLINNQNQIIKNQDLYNLKNISYNFEIKNSANKFLIFKIISKNGLFALTSPIYINN
ncbi:hypothetical protein [Candidatus Arthromitus sp. SFB-turkey]|uniref:hypothetical protein n=1 Tax=Candidatus Arthromitus sp. SFB-turkey TaxID=1840217 RepID=UPI0007F558A6|nr:hypothetical protein [Candidatus Arthromitus sp. SFB-turkey]OAT88899.1 hypothetical protein A6P36_06020 [Candidatus Arthromitus sp. SFB-turkey]